jgi:hypothetical protein
LDGNVELNNFVQVACMPQEDSSQLFDTIEAWASGWVWENRNFSILFFESF